MKKNLLILFVIPLILSACSKRENIRTGQLQTVLTYYNDSVSDTYKQRAAQFLIDNMDAHYTLQSEGIDS